MSLSLLLKEITVHWYLYSLVLFKLFSDWCPCWTWCQIILTLFGGWLLIELISDPCLLVEFLNLLIEICFKTFFTKSITKILPHYRRFSLFFKLVNHFCDSKGLIESIRINIWIELDVLLFLSFKELAFHQLNIFLPRFHLCFSLFLL